MDCGEGVNRRARSGRKTVVDRDSLEITFEAVFRMASSKLSYALITVYRNVVIISLLSHFLIVICIIQEKFFTFQSVAEKLYIAW